jgi:hypothetical protein
MSKQIQLKTELSKIAAGFARDYARECLPHLPRGRAERIMKGRARRFMIESLAFEKRSEAAKRRWLQYFKSTLGSILDEHKKEQQGKAVRA